MRQEGEHDERPGKPQPLFVAAIGLEFLSTVLGGFVLGFLLDKYLSSSPWFMASFTILALIGALIRLVRLLERFSGEDK